MTIRNAASIACFCIAIAGPAHAGGQARIEPPYGHVPAQPPLEPQAAFDAAAALEAIGRGTSSIQGAACAYHDNLQFPAAHQKVYLLPLTPYLEEWLQLRKQSHRARIAPLSNAVFEARVETQTDNKGRFRFPAMKPGRYYIVVPFAFNQAKSRDVYAGSGHDAYGSVAYYQRQDYTVGHNDQLEQVVQVKRDGQTVKTAVRNSGFWNKGGLFGKLLPCKW